MNVEAAADGLAVRAAVVINLEGGDAAVAKVERLRARCGHVHVVRVGVRSRAAVPCDVCPHFSTHSRTVT